MIHAKAAMRVIYALRARSGPPACLARAEPVASPALGAPAGAGADIQGLNSEPFFSTWPGGNSWQGNGTDALGTGQVERLTGDRPIPPGVPHEARSA
nr:hypothetical protein GCM10020092_052810 [Actinoplanes digitatis]